MKLFLVGGYKSDSDKQCRKDSELNRPGKNPTNEDTINLRAKELFQLFFN